MKMVSPAAIVFLFAEDFARENKSLKKGAKFFEWQKRYDAFETVAAAFGVTIAKLKREGKIQLRIKKGFLGMKRLVFVRTTDIPEEYGVIARGLQSISPYKEVELKAALFLSIPISPLPTHALSRYVIQRDLKGYNYEELRHSLEIQHEKENLKRILEEFKRDEEIWKLFLKSLEKAMDMCRGKEGITLYTPLDMLEDAKNENKKGTP
ncbi:hypothetical protein [Palaeococcus sp. (in: euryarchaeotes)]